MDHNSTVCWGEIVSFEVTLLPSPLILEGLQFATHTIHVWHIYLHLVVFTSKIHSTWMLWVPWQSGIITVLGPQVPSMEGAEEARERWTKAWDRFSHVQIMFLRGFFFQGKKCCCSFGEGGGGGGGVKWEARKVALIGCRCLGGFCHISCNWIASYIPTIKNHPMIQ